MKKNLTKLFWLCLMLAFYQDLYSQKQPNFNKDIAPIIFKNCTPCHREGENAPFPLTNYKEVHSKAKIIGQVVRKRYMPPWKADPAYRHFENEMYLKNEEIDLISKWVAGNAPEGKGTLMEYSMMNIEEERKPDVVISMPVKYPIQGNNKESFSWMKIPYEIPSTHKEIEIEKIEYIPGNKKLLHHVNYKFIRVPSGLDIFEGPYFKQAEDTLEEGFSIYNYFNIFPYQTYYTGGWLPGMNAQEYGEDIGIVIPRKGIVFIDKNHYNASPIADTDSSHLNIYFKKKPLERKAVPFSMGSSKVNSTMSSPLVIPADSIKTFTVSCVLDMDVSVLYIAPHMHLLGKQFIAYAKVPSGDSIPLIKIDNWDFNWQFMYKLSPYLKLPKGTVIWVKASYDNTVNNIRNPFHPPRTSYSSNGMKTTEEMLELGLLIVPYKEGDELLIHKN